MDGTERFVPADAGKPAAKAGIPAFCLTAALRRPDRSVVYPDAEKKEDGNVKRRITAWITAVLFTLLMIPARGEEAGSIAGTEGNTVPFGPGDTIVKEGFCEMSSLYSEVLDDAAMAEGWYYYYTDTDVSPADVIDWAVSEGNYTTAEVLFSVRNISEEPLTFLDKVTAVMSFRENGDSGPILFDGTVFRQNPGQVEKSGEMIMWSTKETELAPGESAHVSFRFDLPREIYEKLYAGITGEDPEVKAACEFGFGDGTTYRIDLIGSMIPASQS